MTVCPHCHTDHYWRLCFDTNMAIADALGAAGFPVATRPVKIYPAWPDAAPVVGATS